MYHSVLLAILSFNLLGNLPRLFFIITSFYQPDLNTGGPTRIRTRDRPVMSRLLYQLSYGPEENFSFKSIADINRKSRNYLINHQVSSIYPFLSWPQAAFISCPFEYRIVTGTPFSFNIFWKIAISSSPEGNKLV